jgi:membrane associated rhomboid family serine protease
MLIPIGHDVDGLRRWPVVTFAIIAICFAVLIADGLAPKPDPEIAAGRFEEAAQYYLEHPELEAHPLLQRWLATAIATQEPEVRDDLQARLDADAESTPLQDARQARLDELTNAWLAALRDGTAGRHGLIPSEATIERAFTHMFVHVGFLHCFFNMLFLYLSGPLIEDVWGRPFFAVFYLLAGLAAAGLFVVQYPDLGVPLVGASGAVAGVLGAMLVRHPQTRIQMLWFWGLMVRRFSVPAWVVLPVWVGGELAWAHVMDYVSPGSGGGGVAHWAHVYGFAFGALVAGAIALFRIERWIAPRAPDDADHAVLRAVERALARDRRDEAWQILRRHVVADLKDRDAALVYWDLAKTMGRCREAAPVLIRVIRSELAAEDPVSALEHWTDLRTQLPDAMVEVDLAARLACVLGDAGASREAGDLVRAALARVDATTPASALVGLAEAARFADRDLAAAVAARALAHPGLPLAVRRELAGADSAAHSG